MYKGFHHGWVAEWLKAHAWKVCLGLKPNGGSNPLPSAISCNTRFGCFSFWFEFFGPFAALLSDVFLLRPPNWPLRYSEKSREVGYNACQNNCKSIRTVSRYNNILFYYQGIHTQAHLPFCFCSHNSQVLQCNRILFLPDSWLLLPNNGHMCNLSDLNSIYWHKSYTFFVHRHNTSAHFCSPLYPLLYNWWFHHRRYIHIDL